MTDDEFIGEVRRALMMILKAILKRYGIDLLKTIH